MLDPTVTTHYDAECFDLALARIHPRFGQYLAMDRGVPVSTAYKPDFLDRIGLAKRIGQYAQANLHHYQGPRSDPAVLAGALRLLTHPLLGKHKRACAQLRTLIERIDQLAPVHLTRTHVNQDGQQIMRDSECLIAELDQYEKRWKSPALGYNKAAQPLLRYPELESLCPGEAAYIIQRCASGRSEACLLSPRQLELVKDLAKQLHAQDLLKALSKSQPLPINASEQNPVTTERLPADAEMDYEQFCAERERRYAAAWSGEPVDLTDVEPGYRAYRFKQDQAEIQNWWGVSRQLRAQRQEELKIWRSYHYVDLMPLRAFWYHRRDSADLVLPVTGEKMRMHACFWPCDSTDILIDQPRELLEELIRALYGCSYETSLDLVRLLERMGLSRAAQAAYEKLDLSLFSPQELCAQLWDLPDSICASQHYEKLAPHLAELRQITGHRRPFSLDHMLRIAQRDDLDCSEAVVWSALTRYAFKIPERRAEIIGTLRFERCTREWVDDAFGDFSRGHFLLSERSFSEIYRAAKAPRMLKRSEASLSESGAPDSGLNPSHRPESRSQQCCL